LRIFDSDVLRYLEHCKYSNLNPTTIKAYRVDITQFLKFANSSALFTGYIITQDVIKSYADSIKDRFPKRTSRRKFASIRVFLGFLGVTAISH